MEKNNIICFDLDGTLTKEICWTSEQCLDATPTELIGLVKELTKKNTVIIYTARQNHLMNATFEWIEKQGIGRCPVSNFKIGTDYYIDDKNIELKNYKFLEKFI
jgi:uncharacterized HAD superfamily protein